MITVLLSQLQIKQINLHLWFQIIKKNGMFCMQTTPLIIITAITYELTGLSVYGFQNLRE